MITDKELSTLNDFNLCRDGSYCDFDEFVIKPKNKERTKWELWSYNEINGNDEFLIELTDFENLKYMYWTLSYKELELKTT